MSVICTVTVEWPAASFTSTPLAYQRMEEVLQYFPLRLARKVMAFPDRLFSPVILTDRLAKTAVTSRFCLKFVSVRVLLVSPSLHLTNT